MKPQPCSICKTQTPALSLKDIYLNKPTRLVRVCDQCIADAIASALADIGEAKRQLPRLQDLACAKNGPVILGFCAHCGKTAHAGSCA